jgi:two-component system cell cycle sensor histidine kinase/response regulator CckA
MSDPTGSARSDPFPLPQRVWRALIEQALVRDVVVTLDRDARIQYLSPSVEPVLGYAASELVGRTVFEFVHPDDIGIAAGAFAVGLSRPGPADPVELRFRHRDGTWRILEAVGNNLLADPELQCVVVVSRDVTDRKRADAEVRAAWDQARQYLEIADVIFVALDRQGRITLVNRKGCEVLGCDRPTELIGRDWFTTVVPGGIAAEVGAMFRAVMDGTADLPEHYENPVRRRNGDLRLISWHNVVVRDTRGHVIGTLSSGEDITDRRNAEEREANLGRILDEAWNEIYIFDAETLRFLEVNRGARRNLGYTMAELRAMTPLDLTPVRSPAQMAGLLEPLRSGARDRLRFEGTNRRKDGTLYPLDLHVQKGTLGGRPVFVGIGLDVTERKRMERQLLQIRMGVERSGEVIFLTDPDGRITYVNPTFERVYGYTTDEALGATPRILKSGLMSPAHYHAFWDALLGKRAVQAEVINRTKDGRLVTVEASANPVLDDSGAIVGFLAIQRDVTERKQHENALLESEARFRAVFEGAAMGMALATTDGRILDVNAALADMLGYARVELVGKTIADITPPEDWKHEVELIRRLERTRAMSGDFEKRYRRKDGSTLWGRLTVSFIPNADGSVRFVIGMVEDITVRREVEAKLRLSDRILDSIGNLVIVADADGDVRYVSPSVARILGYAADEVLGDGWWRRTRRDGEAADRERRAMADMAAGREPISTQPYERSLLDRNGNERWLAWTDTRGPDGLLIGVGHDVTERKRAEEALRASEATFRALFEHAVYGIFRSTPEGRFLSANPALVALLGYDSEEEVLALDLGKDVYVSGAFRKTLIDDQVTRPEIRGVEAEWKRKDGSSFTARLSGRAVRAPDGTVRYFEMVVEDVSERRSLEVQLRHAQKLEAVGQLTAGIAHDFNNILTTIITNAELIAAALPPELPELRADVREISAVSGRAAEMIRKLTAFSRREHLDLEPLNVDEFVQGMAQVLRRVLPETIEIVVVAERAGGARANRGAMEQVLLNLATNARDAMPEGGTLKVDARQVYLDETFQATHGVGDPGAYVCISVSDSGSGMDARTRAKIFEPFFTTKPVGKGTGLGLAMVYGLVKQHGGYINVYSEPSRGTTFRIYLPAIDNAPSGTLAAAETADARGGTETILVVEDEESIRRSARRILERFGYHVMLAANGEEAAGFLQSHGDELDLVITDVVMPRLGGIQLYQTARAAGAKVKFIFSSGYSTAQIEGTGGPDVPFLHKPWTVAELLNTVREVLDARG